jgi:hypothetical protein
MLEGAVMEVGAAYAKAKRAFTMAVLTIAAGLAVAGSVDRTAGGVILLAGWIGAIASLHRLGRTGSNR